MATFDDPFDLNRRLSRQGCSCGQHATQAEHEAASALSGDGRLMRVVEGAVMRALFPDSEIRFERALGLPKSLIATRRT